MASCGCGKMDCPICNPEMAARSSIDVVETSLIAVGALRESSEKSRVVGVLQERRRWLQAAGQVKDALIEKRPHGKRAQEEPVAVAMMDFAIEQIDNVIGKVVPE